MWKKLLASCLFVLAGAGCARAAEINTQLEADYTIGASDSAKVKLDYTLTNTSAAVYVSQYQLVIPENGTSGIVFQPGQQQATKEEHTDHDRRVIDLTFTNDVVGQGKSRQFSLEYTSRQLLTRRGSTQVIKIEPLPNWNNFDSYKTIVRVPNSLGTPDIIVPEPVKSGTGSGQLVYTFDQSDGQTITLGYGQEQVLQFQLDYHLFNRDNSPAYQTVIFPGDRDDWQFIWASLQPAPLTWQALPDGSWQGIYLLEAGQDVLIEAEGYVVDRVIDRDFRIADAYPALASSFNAFNIDALPEDYQQPDRGQITLSSELVRHGFLPWLDRYQLQIHNGTGFSLDRLQLQLDNIQGQVTIKPTGSDFRLLPWQKTVIIAQVRPRQWWRLYARFQADVTVRDEQGQIIITGKLQGLGFSWPAAAALGGVAGFAAVAGSLLVARRQATGDLRRQGQKSS